jgi:hypothetical protein
MRTELERVRARRTPEEQGTTDAGTPVVFHDMLIIGPAGAQRRNELFRVPVVKVPKPAAPSGEVGDSEEPNAAAAPEQASSSGRPGPIGNYVDLPEKLDLYDYAMRRNMAIARPQDWGAKIRPERSRGPAFGTLPVKREPAATNCFACYLVDAENFSFRNAWTAEEWNDIGAEDLPPHPSADAAELEVMLAGPRGKVFHLKLVLETEGKDLWPPGKAEQLPNGGFIESLDLRHEMEIWNQLRNGTVAGRVLSYRKAARENKPPADAEYVPLVNITSLIADDPLVAPRVTVASASAGGQETRSR